MSSSVVVMDTLWKMKLIKFFITLIWIHSWGWLGSIDPCSSFITYCKGRGADNLCLGYWRWLEDAVLFLIFILYGEVQLCVMEVGWWMERDFIIHKFQRLRALQERLGGELGRSRWRELGGFILNRHRHQPWGDLPHVKGTNNGDPIQRIFAPYILDNLFKD